MKWIGFLLVLIGTGGIGLSIAGEYTRRIQVLEQIRLMMHYIKELVLHERASLPESFERVSGRMQEPLSDFLKSVAGQMEEFSGEDIDFLWKNNAQKLKGYLNKKDYSAFETCMKQTGFMDAKGQSQAITSYEKRLELQVQELTQQKEEKCKLYQTLGIMSGVFVCILLL